jgi:hypothetical protein
MGATIPNREAVHHAALASIAKLEANFKQNIDRLIHEADAFIKAKTPVNTGLAVRNMIWVRGEGHNQRPDALGTGDPGPTNSMALGTEPRRGENEAAAAVSLTTLNLGDPFGVFTLQNNAEDIVGLELGIYPGAPLSNRSPQGMFGLASVFFKAKIEAKGILS